MALPTPLEIIDDDDFDWEAAVREIDAACESSKQSAKFPVGTSDNVPATTFCPKPGKRPIPPRQSTLDKFIGAAPTKPSLPLENQNPDVESGDTVGECDGGVSFVKIDPEAAKTWIYPSDRTRVYQRSITETALFSNTLVVLPTGLGKTHIAAVVMYNYFRWFPQGKIVFAAPSRPLVMQQIEACHNTVGIPQEWTIDMTGQTSPIKRASLWKAKRVFFVTPQVLEKDIQSGSCLVKYIVCLVIDEAHRASGNYSYCVAVRELMAIPVQLRILALTATPGSKQQTIQQIIDNLKISTLEYRNESDHDVNTYVHGRKVELIKVSMGQDAIEVTNLLLEVVRPFVARLSAIGVLQKRDFQTMSPCDLLNSRDKFRQAPPQELPHCRYGEIEGYFAILITLYHIRKLLSSHGIRPALEMLEEKLNQGSFARLMSKNEVLFKAKLQMQQSLSHGHLSPKFAKMLEVLTEHFKTEDPKNSRVIIFTNFRGSVRDIMNALASIGELVKATEFIGQSSGKASKGQSQKVQQAVLEKFRAGGYNVIVATSIGEEGLDIMEVGLVICFDANVSPLRMIQRMGRTGRKSEGRVVVLACEGPELKGYLRKQANDKTVQKYMQNGGINSFHFHPSPRMVPHVFKPQCVHVELTIEQYIPRGKKVMDDHATQIPVCRTKLTNTEASLVAKYFHPSDENNWRLSLIAFPHFQAYPSIVHDISHSIRTEMLIDTMQYLQGLPLSNDNKVISVEEDESSEQYLKVESVKQCDGCDHSMEEVNVIKNLPECDIFLSLKTSESKEKDDRVELEGQHPSTHSFLFGPEFVSLDAFGRVLILSVPVLPLKKNNLFKCSSPSKTLFENSSKDDCFHSKPSPEELLDGSEKAHEPQISNVKLPSEADRTTATPSVVTREATFLLAHASDSDFKHADLSPRLSSLMKCDVVPESPIGISSNEVNDFVVPDLHVGPKLDTVLFAETLGTSKNDISANECTSGERNVRVLCKNDEIQSPAIDFGNRSHGMCTSASIFVEEIQTPPFNLSHDTCSKDWVLGSGEKSDSVKQKPKFKRLRKYGDVSTRKFSEGTVEVDHTEILGRSYGVNNRGRGEKKEVKDARVFIEEEAEVSSEVSLSEDEEDEHEQDSYDNSFIDDETDTTIASTQAVANKCDMMAIYRRSLLSQSPISWKTNFVADVSPDNAHNNGRSEAREINPSPYNSPNDFVSKGEHLSPSPVNFKSLSEAMHSTINGLPSGNERTIESRKRKLCSEGATLPIHNLEQEFLFNSEISAKQPSEQHLPKEIEGNMDMFDDDQFYEGIDLDALEEEAATLLKYKSDSSKPTETTNPDPIPQSFSLPSSPTFDLGI